jgi:hypothetical protein
MSASHTPGPWIAERNRSDYGNYAVRMGDNDTMRADRASRFVACNVIHAADARLIAAAPDLLAALTVLATEAGNCRIYPETIDAALAAIAKAVHS